MDWNEIFIYAALAGQLVAAFIRRLPETSIIKNKYIPAWIGILSWIGFFVEALRTFTEAATAPASFTAASLGSGFLDVVVTPLGAAFIVVVLSRAFHKFGWSGLFG